MTKTSEFFLKLTKVWNIISQNLRTKKIVLRLKKLYCKQKKLYCAAAIFKQTF